MRRLPALERLLPLSLLAVALVSVPILLLSEGGLERVHRLEKEKAVVAAHVAELEGDIRRLRAEANHIKEDPSRVEQVARDELGLVRQTEVVFQFKHAR